MAELDGRLFRSWDSFGKVAVQIIIAAFILGGMWYQLRGAADQTEINTNNINALTRSIQDLTWAVKNHVDMDKIEKDRMVNEFSDHEDRMRRLERHHQ